MSIYDRNINHYDNNGDDQTLGYLKWRSLNVSIMIPIPTRQIFPSGNNLHRLIIFYSHPTTVHSVRFSSTFNGQPPIPRQYVDDNTPDYADERTPNPNNRESYCVSICSSLTNQTPSPAVERL